MPTEGNFNMNLPIGGAVLAILLPSFTAPEHIRPIPISLKELMLALDFPGVFFLTRALVFFFLILA